MSLEAELQQYVMDLNFDLHQKRVNLEREKADLEKQLLTLETRLKALRRRDKRITSFFEELRRGLVCPSCWIKEEVRAEVKPIPSGPGENDFFRCSRCTIEFEVPV